MSDTPETAAFFFRTDIEWDDEVEFARKLERERDEAREQNEEQARLLAMSADREEKLRAEIAGWENKWQCAVELAALAKVRLHDVKEALQ